MHNADEIKFEHLSQQDIDAAVRLYKSSHIPVILKHLFDKQIAEQRDKYDNIPEDELKAIQAAIKKMKDLRGVLKLEKPLTQIRQ